MDDKYAWNALYSVGNLTLDEQHKKLLELCRRVELNMRDASRESLAEFHAILNDLTVYADIHFRTEEQILKQARYPQLAEQIAEHQAYRDKVTDFLFSATLDSFDKEGLASYLSDWWVSHILDSDMHFKDYLTAG